MGSSEFIQTSHGTSAKRAFRTAVKTALYDHGHNGYTGTIAEKSEEGFIMFPFQQKARREAILIDRAVERARRPAQN